MSTIFSRRSGLLATLAAVGLLAATGGQAQAGYVYAYAQQQIIGLKATYTPVSVGSLSVTSPITPQANTSAVLANGGVLVDGDAATTNPSQAFVGDNAFNPGQDVFAPVGQQIGTDFSRADARVQTTALFGAGVNANTVAEANVSTPPGLEFGSSNSVWSLGATIRLTGAGQISYTADFVNQLIGQYIGPDGQFAQSGVTFSFSIRTLTGTSVWESTPGALNQTISLANAGLSTVGLNSPPPVTATSPILAAGFYRLSVQATSSTNVVALVPEPSSLALVGFGAVGLVSLAVRRQRAVRSA